MSFRFECEACTSPASWGATPRADKRRIHRLPDIPRGAPRERRGAAQALLVLGAEASGLEHDARAGRSPRIEAACAWPNLSNGTSGNERPTGGSPPWEARQRALSAWHCRDLAALEKRRQAGPKLLAITTQQEGRGQHSERPGHKRRSKTPTGHAALRADSHDSSIEVFRSAQMPRGAARAVNAASGRRASLRSALTVTAPLSVAF